MKHVRRPPIPDELEQSRVVAIPRRLDARAAVETAEALVDNRCVLAGGFDEIEARASRLAQIVVRATT
jgi:hypothetical protein